MRYSTITIGIYGTYGTFTIVNLGLQRGVAIDRRDRNLRKMSVIAGALTALILSNLSLLLRTIRQSLPSDLNDALRRFNPGV